MWKISDEKKVENLIKYPGTKIMQDNSGYQR